MAGQVINQQPFMSAVMDNNQGHDQQRLPSAQSNNPPETLHNTPAAQPLGTIKRTAATGSQDEGASPGGTGELNTSFSFPRVVNNQRPKRETRVSSSPSDDGDADVPMGGVDDGDNKDGSSNGNRRSSGEQNTGGEEGTGNTRAEGADAAGGRKKKKPNRFYCTEFPPCDLSFTRSEHLARHIRKHTGERPFVCHCSRKFSRLDNLRQHAQTVHANEDIPVDSLAATGTRFQRQVRTERVGGARLPPVRGHGPVRGHHRNAMSVPSIPTGHSIYGPREDDRRPPYNPVAVHQHRASISSFDATPYTPPQPTVRFGEPYENIRPRTSGYGEGPGPRPRPFTPPPSSMRHMYDYGSPRSAYSVMASPGSVYAQPDYGHARRSSGQYPSPLHSYDERPEYAVRENQQYMAPGREYPVRDPRDYPGPNGYRVPPTQLPLPAMGSGVRESFYPEEFVSSPTQSNFSSSSRRGSVYDPVMDDRRKTWHGVDFSGLSTIPSRSVLNDFPSTAQHRSNQPSQSNLTLPPITSFDGLRVASPPRVVQSADEHEAVGALMDLSGPQSHVQGRGSQERIAYGPGPQL